MLRPKHGKALLSTHIHFSQYVEIGLQRLHYNIKLQYIQKLYPVLISSGDRGSIQSRDFSSTTSKQILGLASLPPNRRPRLVEGPGQRPTACYKRELFGYRFRNSLLRVLLLRMLVTCYSSVKSLVKRKGSRSMQTALTLAQTQFQPCQ
jgi:hypothetical protein